MERGPKTAELVDNVGLLSVDHVPIPGLLCAPDAVLCYHVVLRTPCATNHFLTVTSNFRGTSFIGQ